MIRLAGISKTYPNGFEAVKEVDLEIEDGEFMVLVGPSGCGKTTLLRIIAGLETVTSGSIHLGDDDVTEVPPQERDIAMVFQNYALYPHMTIADNLAYALKLRRVRKGERRRRVEEVAETLGLEELLDRKPAALSGGQRQRVAKGRANIREPQAFLMDEPLSNLDAKLRVSMRAELSRLHERLRVTTVYVTHDQVEAMTLGQRVAVMRGGVVEQVDTPHELFHRPRSLFVATFIGSPSMNLVETTVEDGAVAFGGHRIALASAAPPAGDRVILGIRPTDFDDGHSADPSLPRIAVTADVVEDLGAEQHVVFSVDAPRVTADAVVAARDGADGTLFRDRRAVFTASIDARRPVRPGERIELAVDNTRFHFFDPTTGAALSPPVASTRAARS
jgi:multiple sugar transport system ATP-binding protein